MSLLFVNFLFKSEFSVILSRHPAAAKNSVCTLKHSFPDHVCLSHLINRNHLKIIMVSVIQLKCYSQWFQ